MFSATGKYRAGEEVVLGHLQAAPSVWPAQPVH